MAESGPSDEHEPGSPDVRDSSSWIKSADVNNDRLSPNLRGLIHVLAAVLVREIDREMAETSTKTRKDPQEGDQTRARVERCSAQPNEMKTRPGEARSRFQFPNNHDGGGNDTAKKFTTRDRREL